MTLPAAPCLAFGLALCLGLLSSGTGSAQDRPSGAASIAAAAAADLQAAITAMQAATAARDRVAALTRTIRAYEQGLDAVREGLRQVTIRESALSLQFEAQRDQIARLVGVLEGLPADPGPLLLLHPAGPLGTARSGMLLADVTPALQAQADRLRSELTEVRDLRAVQEAASATLAAGLDAAQKARSALSQAISNRTDLPMRFIDDPAALKGLLESADTLDAFAAGLGPDIAAEDLSPDITAARGTLPMPVLGTILRRPDEADAAGVRRPGLLIATRARALVTAPWPATIRYRGPLLDYGNVMILELGRGYLLILAGLGTVYGEVGEVVASGAALGLMGGSEAGATEFPVSAQDGGGAGGSETIYVELRKGADPVDPTGWFAGTME
ncbi:MAG: peptidoglycan DD-metalloendopeptidase family protein [Rhodobacter sp.]|nr:peptidoglycan DD-metalloendopeptidase family protein [Rhodobacter sp.]MCA3513685.1 peptidoglycan DD-metalloendopeptidase family protein [Rhodobacter sp.]MCA3520456.1 peptidoglycan DD-metalloendopeptidase family protein [Rhodobacter sp.]MCA3526064.1 peptidoglycan DD-metalloendopeptidase family protein [Rhodobacter sp.]MCA3529720.1 peptidoglycan DD-metalloendopeptidase family protein [Rhodobacter sp.]